MRLILMTMWLIALSACTRVVEKPVQIPFEVKVPVIVPCAPMVPVPPPWATEQLTGKESDCELVKTLLIERLQQKTYIKTLQAALAGCTNPE